MRRLVFLAIVAVLATACDRPVRLGAIVSRTGAAAPYGERVAHGFDLAVEEIDRAGGIRGRRIELIYADDATNPDVGLSAARELVGRDHVPVILGAVSSPVTLRLAAYCERERVVLLTPSASAPAITHAGAFVFRAFPSDDVEAASMAEFARDLGLGRVSVLREDDDYGRSLARIFEDRFEATGGEIGVRASFAEGDPASVAKAAAEIARASPRGLYLPAYVADAAAALRRLRDLGAKPIVLATSAVTDELPRLAGVAADNVVFPKQAFDPDGDDPAARAFAVAYRAAFGDNPDVYAAHAYDTVRVLASAADRAGSWSPDAIRQALLSLDNFEGVTGRMAFDENGDVIQYPRLFVIRGGQIVPYDRFLESGGALPVPGR